MIFNLYVKSQKKKFKKKGIINFRNKYVGHIWDNDNQRPLLKEEIDEYLEKIIGENESAFIEWVNNPKANNFPNTVVSITEEARQTIVDKYNLKESDLFPWNYDE